MDAIEPSTVRDDVLAWLRFILVPGISVRRQRALLHRFRRPDAIVDRAPEALENLVSAEQAAALARGPDPRLVDATLSWLAAPGRRLVAMGDVEYPGLLLETPDAPPVLYASGRIELLRSAAIAIVGSRNATPHGLRDAEAFARALSEAGFCIVSGLAHGIDTAAHRGGLAAHGSSIAVVGTGPDRVYPKANLALARRLEAEGCVISEFPLGTPPAEMNFPRRNRLISGLSKGVLVVEAAERSGSLHTARFALEQNREVFAVPGSIHSTLSKGCHWLIKEGATLVESAHDVLGAFGIHPAPTASAPEEECADPLLRAMGFAPACADQIARRCGLDAAAVSTALSRLELEGRVCSLPGGRFQRIAMREGAGREAPPL